MTIANLVPTGNATDASAILTTNDYTNLDNASADSTNGAVTVANNNAGANTASWDAISNLPATDAIASATLYVVARINNVGGNADTNDWRVRVNHGGSTYEVTYTQADTGYTQKTATITSPTETDLNAATIDVRQVNFAAIKGNDGQVFEIDEIWIEVDYTASPETEINGLLGEINLEGFAPTTDTEKLYAVTSQVGELNLESAHDSLPVTYVYTINPTRGEINFDGFAPTVSLEGRDTNLDGLLSQPQKDDSALSD